MDQNVDGRRPGSPTAVPPEQRQGDTVGGADTFPKATSAPADAPVDAAGTNPADASPEHHLVAVITGTDRAPGLRGTLDLRHGNDGVTVTSDLAGLPPGTYHYDIRDGDCSQSTATEGTVTPGDLGTLTATGNGDVVQNRLVVAALGGADFQKLDGRAVVVRSSGGAAVGCGQIGAPPPTEAETL